MGQILFYAGRFDEAADAFKRALELDPHFVQGHRALADMYESRGMLREAADEFGKISSRRFPTEEAREYWSERVGQPLDTSPFMRARVCAAARRFDEAMVELDAAYRRHEGPLVTLAVDPMFREMKDDPRYRALLAKVELNHSIQRHTSG